MPPDRVGALARRSRVLRWRLLVVAVVVVCWEVLPRLMDVPNGFIVPLSEAVAAGQRERGAVLEAMGPTLSAILTALAVTWVGGVALGFLLGSTQSLRFLTAPLGAFYAVPFVVLYPLLSVWLGPGQTSKIAFACLYGFIPVVLTTAAGVAAVEGSLTLAARSMGATKGQLMSKVLMPAALPSVLSGLRLGGGLVIIAVIVAEMLASTSGGIGTLITAYRVNFDAAAVYFTILVVLAVALVMDQGLGLAEKKVSRGQTTFGRPPAVG